MRLLSIGDIHGCANSFEKLLEQINLKKDDTLVLLGDYIDRGTDSKAVLDKIIQLQQSDYQVIALRGNHEAALLSSILGDDREYFKQWTTNFGGLATMKSFGDPRHFLELIDPYMDFLKNTKLYYCHEEYIFVHAGIDTYAASPFDDEESLLWTRHWEEDIYYEWLGNRKIVYGHTPQTVYKTTLQMRQLAEKQYICLDTGAVFLKSGMQQLCCADFTHRKLYFQENDNF
jgi:serine/threonine protein phosphatase 1